MLTNVARAVSLHRIFLTTVAHLEREVCLCLRALGIQAGSTTLSMVISIAFFRRVTHVAETAIE